MPLFPVTVSRVRRDTFDPEVLKKRQQSNCKCSLSFATLLRTNAGGEFDDESGDDGKAYESALTPRATSKRMPNTSQSEKANLMNTSATHSSLLASAVMYKSLSAPCLTSPPPLPPQFRRTAKSCAIPLHRCETHRLIQSFPQQFHNSQWVPIFDTKTDGYSLSNFYRSLHLAREGIPMIRAAVGFFEVLTREQWEAAASNVEEETNCVPSSEHPTPHMSIYSAANTQTRPSLYLNTASPTVVNTDHTLGYSSTPPQRVPPSATHIRSSSPRSPLASSTRVAVLERVASWTAAADSSPSPPRHNDGVPTVESSPKQAVPTVQMPSHANLLTPSVIGAFCPMMPTLEHGPHHFFGSRETAIFAFTDVKSELEMIKLHAEKVSTSTPPRNRSTSVQSTQATGAVAEPSTFPRHFRYHKWSGRNEEFLICSPHFLGIGGGAEGAALYIDEDIQFGTSADNCPTFGMSFAENAPAVNVAAQQLLRRRRRLEGAVSTGKGTQTVAREEALRSDGVSVTQSRSPPKSTASSSAWGCAATGTSGSLFGTRVVGLDQTEFFIVRMQWFGIDEGTYVDLCAKPVNLSQQPPQRLNAADAGSQATVPLSPTTPPSSFLHYRSQLSEDNRVTVPKEVRKTIASDLGIAFEDDTAHTSNAVMCGCGGQGPLLTVHQCEGF